MGCVVQADSHEDEEGEFFSAICFSWLHTSEI